MKVLFLMAVIFASLPAFSKDDAPVKRSVAQAAPYETLSLVEFKKFVSTINSKYSGGKNDLHCLTGIRVHTGGNMGTGTATLCMDKSEVGLYCRNDMLGSWGGALFDMTKPLDGQLVELISSQCTGG